VGVIVAKRLFAMLLGLVCLAGCRMCASPYDDCYPVIESDYPPPGPVPQPDDGYFATGNQSGHSGGQAIRR
jgi:hypothetical protein